MWFEVAAISKCQPDVGCPFDDVVVGEYQTIRGDDDAAARSASRLYALAAFAGLAAHLDVHNGG